MPGKQRLSISPLALVILVLLPATLSARSQTTPPDAQGTSAIFNVRDFGAAGDGKALDTAAIMKAIKECAQRGGGTVTFPPGRYVTGTFELLSNVTLYLDAGAVIVGSTNLEDYGRIVGFQDVREHPATAA
jgi:polygalacturonase